MNALFRIARVSVFAVALAGALGCSEASNTPEQALEQVKTALKNQDWALLYDVVPPDLRKAWNEDVVDIDDQVTKLKSRDAKLADQALRERLGVSLADWEAAGKDARKRFALRFAPTAKLGLAELGVNIDEVLSSQVKSADVKGDQAFFSIDDGKGHRSKLRFKLIEGRWCFDLERIKKDSG